MILIEHIYLIEVNNIMWMFYGLILGIAFSMFLQGIPSETGSDETPAKIYRSFKHHFTYFCGIFTVIMAWLTIAIIIVFVQQAF